MAGFNHLMLQTKSIDDVGSAYDMLEEQQVPLTLSLGRHTNDRTFSFYCATPSLFNIELGFDGVEVTPDWVPQVYNKTAIWGHKLDPEAKKPAAGDHAPPCRLTLWPAGPTDTAPGAMRPGQLPFRVATGEAGPGGSPGPGSRAVQRGKSLAYHSR